MNLASLDRWITGNYGADNDPDWGVCPDCGASQEDAEQEDGDTYVCPCGLTYSNDDAHADPRDDEPADFDEWRDNR